MAGLFPAAGELAWPLVLALAWIAGELAQHWKLPRISAYAGVGFLCAPGQLGLLPGGDENFGAVLANLAFGLILFEFGYRINLHWFRINPWLAATGLLEAALTFGATYAVARLLGSAPLTALLLGSVAMASSPASLVRIVNDMRSSGQVTERALHLAALDCVLAVFAFKVIVGFWTFDSSGDLLKAVSSSVVVLAVSASLGVAFGVGVTALLRASGRLRVDGTIAFAIAVIVLVALTHGLKYSPLLAALAFGLVARHRRVTLTQAQRNFGALGDLLAVFLFVHIAATVEWQRALTGLGLGAALVAARLGAKMLGITLLARASGTTVRKGLLTALAMLPMSAFVVLLLEDTRYLGVDLIDTLAPLAAATLLLDVLGPIGTQLALVIAGETHNAARVPPATDHAPGTVQDL
jgi:Kef-type K+ transport system membrane component KefB